MKHAHLVHSLIKLQVWELFVTKMRCTKRISLYKSLRTGVVALLGIFVGQLVKTLYSGGPFDMIDIVSIPLTIYCVIGYLILSALEAHFTALKEVVCDILATKNK